MTTQQLRTDLERKKGARDSLISQKTQVEKDLLSLTKEYEEWLSARVQIQIVAKQTQQSLEYHISEMVTNALATVFDNPYEFKLEFVLRRDKTEADRLWLRNGEQYQPNGGGVRDVSAFALRLAMWKIAKGTPILLLDEPAKHTSQRLLPRVSALFAQVAKQLGIQIIMVSHAKELIKSADKAYEVIKTGEISQVKELER